MLCADGFDTQAESKLFTSKPKEPPTQEATPAATVTEVRRDSRVSSHRRSKSEPIELPDETSVLQAELLKLALRHNKAGKVPIQDGAQRAVGSIIEASPDLAKYARSVVAELDSVGAMMTESPARKSKNPVSPKDEIYDKKHEILHNSQNLGTKSLNGRKMPESLQAREVEPPLIPTNSREHWSTLTQPSNSKYTGHTELRSPKKKLLTATDSTLVDEAINSRMWGLTASSLVDPLLPAQAPEILNCTGSRDAEAWKITDSTLKAYTAMRGSYQVAGRDLFVWMDRCGKSFRKPEECNEHVGSPKS